MIILLSPAKTLDFESKPTYEVCTQPDFLSFSHELIKGLANLSSEEISSLMDISEKLSELNRSRYREWNVNHDPDNAKQAVLAFKGDVYEGLRAWNFKKDDFVYAQKHLRILSGLYGILRPLDLIQPHRLEMGTLYANPAGRDLYCFWGDRLCQAINQDLKNLNSDLLINLASQEYFKATRENSIDARVVSPIFKDEKKGKFKIISFYAKKARGLMSSYLIRNEISDLEGLLEFSEFGYQYSKSQSTPNEPVFLRSEENRIAV